MAIYKPSWFELDIKTIFGFGRFRFALISIWWRGCEWGREWGVGILPYAYKEGVESGSLFSVCLEQQPIPLSSYPFYLRVSFLWVFNKSFMLGKREPK